MRRKNEKVKRNIIGTKKNQHNEVEEDKIKSETSIDLVINK
jgi:hypothetical protein